MGYEIEINIGTLSSDIVGLTENLTVIRNKLKTMYEAMAELNEMWDGPASEEVKKQFNDDYENMEMVCGAVGKIIEYMTYAKDMYHSCEEDNEAIIDNITV